MLQILRQKQELEKERETIARLQSNDLSLERFEALQQTILDQKAEISQLKQAKLAQLDELEVVIEVQHNHVRNVVPHCAFRVENEVNVQLITGDCQECSKLGWRHAHGLIGKPGEIR